MHEKLETLEEVTAWIHARGFALVEIVTQDEYTHDVVVAAEEPRYLVFDTGRRSWATRRACDGEA